MSQRDKGCISTTGHGAQTILRRGLCAFPPPQTPGNSPSLKTAARWPPGVTLQQIQGDFRSHEPQRRTHHRYRHWLCRCWVAELQNALCQRSPGGSMLPTNSTGGPTPQCLWVLSEPHRGFCCWKGKAASLPQGRRDKGVQRPHRATAVARSVWLSDPRQLSELGVCQPSLSTDVGFFKPCRPPRSTGHPSLPVVLEKNGWECLYRTAELEVSAAPGHQMKRNRNAKYSSSPNAQDQIRPICQESKQKADLPSLGKCDAEVLGAPDFVLQDELSNSLCIHFFKKEVPINPHPSSSAPLPGCQQHTSVTFSLETKLRLNHFRKQIPYVRLRKNPALPRTYGIAVSWTDREDHRWKPCWGWQTWIQKGRKRPWSGERATSASRLPCSCDEIPAENLHWGKEPDAIQHWN